MIIVTADEGEFAEKRVLHLKPSIQIMEILVYCYVQALQESAKAMMKSTKE